MVGFQSASTLRLAAGVIHNSLPAHFLGDLMILDRAGMELARVMGPEPNGYVYDKVGVDRDGFLLWGCKKAAIQGRAVGHSRVVGPLLVPRRGHVAGVPRQRSHAVSGASPLQEWAVLLSSAALRGGTRSYQSQATGQCTSAGPKPW
jgi:hypothetical protein